MSFRQYIHRSVFGLKKRISLALNRLSRLRDDAQRFTKKARAKHVRSKAFSTLLFAGVLATLWYGIVLGKAHLEAADTSLRFGAIGDFEYGTRYKVGNKLTSRSREELEKVISIYNTTWHPAFVVELGDMVESSGLKQAKALRQFRDIDAVFRTLDARTEYVIGNHDVRALSKEDVRTVLGLDANHRSFDEGAWRFVIADTNFDKEQDGASLGPKHFSVGFVPKSELAWLESVLDTDRPTILFLHHPPIPGGGNLRDYREFRTFLARYPNIVLTVSGHDPHFKIYEADGFSSLVVDNLANKDSLGSFATMEARYNSLTKRAEVLIEHFGPTRRSIVAEKTIDNKRPWWINTLDRFGMLPE